MRPSWIVPRHVDSVYVYVASFKGNRRHWWQPLLSLVFNMCWSSRCRVQALGLVPLLGAFWGITSASTISSLAPQQFHHLRLHMTYASVHHLRLNQHTACASHDLIPITTRRIFLCAQSSSLSNTHTYRLSHFLGFPVLSVLSVFSGRPMGLMIIVFLFCQFSQFFSFSHSHGFLDFLVL